MFRFFALWLLFVKKNENIYNDYYHFRGFNEIIQLRFYLKNYFSDFIDTFNILSIVGYYQIQNTVANI